jgi:hypothetical protein
VRIVFNYLRVASTWMAPLVEVVGFTRMQKQGRFQTGGFS